MTAPTSPTSSYYQRSSRRSTSTENNLIKPHHLKNLSIYCYDVNTPVSILYTLTLLWAIIFGCFLHIFEHIKFVLCPLTFHYPFELQQFTFTVFGYYAGPVASKLYFERKIGSLSRSDWWQLARFARRAVQFGRVAWARQDAPGFLCVTDGKSLPDSPAWIRRLDAFSDSLICLPSMWETGLNDAVTHGGTGRSSTGSRLCALHLYLPFLRTCHGTGRRQVDR